MIVEDEGIVALSLRRRLESLGYEVPIVVGSGEEAVQQAQATELNLILMDIRLHGAMDGIEAATQIRLHSDIPIIYLTANSDEDTLQRAKLTQPFGYLLKPFEERELHTSIETVLYKHQVEQELARYRFHLEQLVTERTAALAELNKNLQREIAERKQLEERLDAIYRLGQELTLLRNEAKIIQRVLETATNVLEFEMAICGLVDWSTCTLQYSYGIPYTIGPSLPLTKNDGRGISVAVVRSGQAICVADITKDDRYVAINGELDIRAELCVPVKIGDAVIGVLNVESKEIGRFTQADQQLLQTLADQMAVALENARLFEQVQVGRQRLQALSSRLVEVQEGERRHLARELHDEVGQVLTGVKLLLQMGSAMPEVQAKTKLTQALELVDELMARVQELSLDLRPTMLDDLGLIPTLAWQFKRYTAQTNIKVDFKYIGAQQRFAPTIETAAFRIVQEALTNVARHANVDEVSIQLWVEADRLRLQIEDQGTGFDPRTVLASNSSNGLSGMQERAKLVGGQLRIESALGDGAQLLAEFPLNGEMEWNTNYD